MTNSNQFTREGGTIFLSYSRDDRDFMVQIEGLLEEFGYDPEYDLEGIATDEKWQERLVEMIREADAFIVVLTESWISSKNCRKELAIARENEVRVISVVPGPLATPNDEALSVAPGPRTLTEDERHERERFRNYLVAHQWVPFFSEREGDGGGFFKGSQQLRHDLKDDAQQRRLRRRYKRAQKDWANNEGGLLWGDLLLQAEQWLDIEGSRGHQVDAEVASYIAESQAARAKAEKKERNRRRGLKLLAGFAAAVCLVATVMTLLAMDRSARADRAEADLAEETSLADADTRRLSSAAKSWALGRSALSTANFLEDQSDVLNAIGLAETHLSASMESLEPIERNGIPTLRIAVGLDLAKGPLIREDYVMAIETLGAVSEDLEEAAIDERSQYLMLDALARCLNEEDPSGYTERLFSAGEDIRKAYSVSALRKFILPLRADCPLASNAICNADLDPGPECDQAATEAQSSAEGEYLSKLSDLAIGAGREDLAIKEVYLHISHEDQRTAAKELEDKLEDGGLNVLGIELIEAPAGQNRSIRYYYADQQTQADALREICATIASDLVGKDEWADPESYRLISLDGRYDNLSQNRVEIWL